MLCVLDLLFLCLDVVGVVCFEVMGVVIGVYLDFDEGVLNVVVLLVVDVLGMLVIWL